MGRFIEAYLTVSPLTQILIRKFETIPLASKGWNHRSSNGDYFVINSHAANPSILRDETSFQTFGFSEAIAKKIEGMGFSKPTHIQKKAFKHVLRGENCLIAAETGSGKTLSYLLPVIQNVLDYKTASEELPKPPPNAPVAVIITPGRELCEQVTEVCKKLTTDLPITIRSLIGGRIKKEMINATFEEVDIVIASFGALSKMVSSQIYDIKRVEHLILDEADTLLDDSFNQKLLHFLRKFNLQATAPQSSPEGVQLIMASATIPRSAEEILAEAVPFSSFTTITTEHLHRLLPHVPQKFVRLSHLDKPTKLLELVKSEVNRKYPVIVFSNKTDRCDWVSMFLNENGVPCANLNGDMAEHLRSDRFAEFRAGKFLALSCTDLVSRGLDTTGVHHVINYDVPSNISDYIHRCGRVGRVGSVFSSGLVTTLVCHPTEANLVQQIEYAARQTHVDELPNVNANIKRLISNQRLKQTV